MARSKQGLERRSITGYMARGVEIPDELRARHAQVVPTGKPRDTKRYRSFRYGFLRKMMGLLILEL
jgi:hypothetical protein